MLEKMGDFFDARLDGYEEHQLTHIANAEEFYPFTANMLPMNVGASVLDLGCGTGLELGYYFAKNPHARVTGIDLAPGMLGELRRKFPDKDLTLHLASYFTFPLGEGCFDAAVSVESIHHYTQAQKIPLYQKVCRALTSDGYFVLTDYLAPDDAWEERCYNALVALRKEEGLREDEFYHYDTPLTLAHETEALLAGGFSRVTLCASWENTYTLIAKK